MAEALFLLLGAIIGGGASFAGSIVLNRRELRRSARVRLFRDLLPSVIDATVDPLNYVFPDARLAREIVREAAIAGKAETELALKVERLWFSHESTTRSSRRRIEDGASLTEGEIDELQDSQHELWRAAADLEARCMKRMR